MKSMSELAESHFADTEGEPAWELGQDNKKQSWGAEGNTMGRGGEPESHPWIAGSHEIIFSFQLACHLQPNASN